jgi:hypothetical protein
LITSVGVTGLSELNRLSVEKIGDFSPVGTRLGSSN